MASLIKLLPIPKELNICEGIFSPNAGAYIIFAGQNDRRLLILNRFRECFERGRGIKLTISCTEDARNIKDGDILLEEDLNLNGEEFRIYINEKNIKINAGGFRGFLYAASALEQIMAQTEGGIPTLTLRDHPDMKHRAYYLDQTRGRVMHMQNLKRFVDKLAFYRYNEFQIYIEHTYAFRDIKELWEDESYFTPDDILELDAYCADRGIELIPSLSCFGHLYKLLRLKRFEKFCEMGQDESEFSFYDRMGHHTMAVIEPEGIELIKSMLAEYMALFRSDKVNICCDETFDLCEGKSKSLLENKTKKEVYIAYVKELCDFVKASGRTPMIWGDVVAEDTELFSLLPSDTVCLSWGYGTDEKDTCIKSLAERGIHQYVCPGVCGWNHFINRIADSFVNIRTMCGFGHSYATDGIMVTDWGDYGHVNHPVFSIPGMIFAAVMSWNKAETDADFAELKERISLIEYRDGSMKAVDLLDAASDCEAGDWGDFVRLLDRREKCGKIGDFAEYERWLDGVRYKVNLKDINETDRKLNDIISQFPACLGENAHIAVNAAEGIKLINHAIAALCLGRSYDELKTETEAWFARYREIFLQNSKESDLEKVHAVLKK